MTKRRKNQNSRAVKIDRMNAATTLSLAWQRHGWEHAVEVATDEYQAAFSRKQGIFAVSMCHLSVEHSGTQRQALRRWISLANTGAHGHHAAPTRPDVPQRSTTVMQHRTTGPRHRPYDNARGSMPILDLEDAE